MCQRASSKELSMPSKQRKRRLMYHNRNRIRCSCPSATSPRILSHSQPLQTRIHRERHQELVLSSRSESEKVKLNHGSQPQLKIHSLIMVLLIRAVANLLCHLSPMARVKLLYLNQITSLTRNRELAPNLSLSGNDNNRKYRWIR